MHLSLNAVACAMRTKNSGVQGRRARSARYARVCQCRVFRFRKEKRLWSRFHADNFSEHCAGSEWSSLLVVYWHPRRGLRRRGTQCSPGGRLYAILRKLS